jgi:hypothetical protein
LLFGHTTVISLLRGIFSVTSHPKPSGKNVSGEYAAFEDALKKVLSIPHSKLKSKLDAEKRKRVKKSSASHAVDAEG